jgi:hypothetical protein
MKRSKIDELHEVVEHLTRALDTALCTLNRVVDDQAVEDGLVELRSGVAAPLRELRR